MNIREPRFAGSFYPSDAGELQKTLDRMVLEETDRFKSLKEGKKIIGGIMPHAGYQYSGPVAVHFARMLKENHVQVDCILILNPNHTGMGSPLEIDDSDAWSTPAGILQVDRELIEAIELPADTLAQAEEHSAEVILPFLIHAMGTKFKILSICMGDQRYPTAVNLAEKIFRASRQTGKSLLLIASSDFSHYVPAKTGKQQDEKVLEKISGFDAAAVEELVRSEHITVCGYGPIMVVMEYAKRVCDHPEFELLRFGNSGRGLLFERVVDYVSGAITC